MSNKDVISLYLDFEQALNGGKGSRRQRATTNHIEAIKESNKAEFIKYLNMVQDAQLNNLGYGTPLYREALRRRRILNAYLNKYAGNKKVKNMN